MVAEQASKLIKDKTVMVVPTKSVPEGICAMIAFIPDNSPEQIFEDMSEAIKNVTSISVTSAVRSTTVSGEKISDGQMLGLVNGSIACVADSTDECLEKLTEKMAGASFITVFYGEGVSDEDAQKTEELIRTRVPMCEVGVIPGGQPLYPYIISVE
jgi:dihydroxyacetone kinase-like predicted kinase